ncbi:hypothetical protein C1T17_15450 [Sphingobium sp. SCG-1]|uniref:hypothetical protein n=1 Tax=Sphingobium sp. SCG-1 TaxID=2072936 RepID=UPI000CD6BAC6|nr:hypothetical protein [Sphingobium sp. SCG-1]AUW59274.1 hypothetical protein C1T17_15450 [Sphingobium sp. SCG-1]
MGNVLPDTNWPRLTDVCTTSAAPPPSCPVVRTRHLNAPVAAPIACIEMDTNGKSIEPHIDDAEEQVKRAASKTLVRWGRADRMLPDL